MKIVLLILVMLIQVSSFAQGTTASANDFESMKKNTIYLELAGNALIYSVNYDRLITPNIACRVGLSALPLNFPDAYSFSFALPMSASYLLNFAGSSSHLEAGIGITPMVSILSGMYASLGIKPEINIMLVPMLGYRLQPKHEGFNFRLLWTPIVVLTNPPPPDSTPFAYWFGLSVGHTF